MSRQPSAGPSATADWVIRQVGIEDRPLPVLILPDAANQLRADAGLPGLEYVLPCVPRVARDSTGRPVLSLSLVLRGRPGPGDDSVFELIETGSLAYDLTLELPAEAQTETLVPLYARQTDFRLLRRAGEADPSVLAEAIGSGVAVRVGLGAQLDRAAAQGVLIALQRGESGLSQTCRVTYRTAESRLVIHLYVRWALVHDHLSRCTDRSGSFTRASLGGHLLDMVGAGVLKAWLVDAKGLETDVTEGQASALLDVFMKVSSTLLESVTPDLDPADANHRYRLRARPAEGLGLDIRLSTTTANEATKDLDAPLEAVLGGILDGFDASAFISLRYVDAAGAGGTSEVPRRVRGGPTTRSGPGGGSARATSLAVVDDDAVAVTRALTAEPARRPSAHVLLDSDAARPLDGPAQAFLVDDGRITGLHAVIVDPIRLPLMDDISAAVWADQANANLVWYPPEFSLVPADPAADPDQSTYQFTFRETGHDSAGRPVLEGEALFTLRGGIGAATQAALAARNNPQALPVRIADLSVTLSLPVRDNAGRLQQLDLPASVTANGDTMTVRVALLNESVRVAYGDLAIAGFQAKPARLNVAYTFPAMVPADDELMLQYVGKIARTPIARSPGQAEQLGQRPYLDAAQVAYRSAMADVTFRQEAPTRTVDGAGVVAGRPATATLTAHSAATLATLQTAQPVVAGRPELESSIRLQEIMADRRYIRQTMGRGASIDAFFACSSMGAFYRQDLGDRMAAIGCQDSFGLGQTAFKLYEQIDDAALASSLYKVHRSLNQPGHFLVVPTTFRITRFAPDQGDRAYRPAIYMYSSLDPTDQTGNRCIVMATLQPDVPSWARKDLEVKLGRLHHSPVTQYVTEIGSELSYDWSLDRAASIEPRAAKLWDSFQVTLSTDLPGGLQLQAILAHGGVAGQAFFKLSDASTLQTSLLLDLAGLTGPWTGGPVETSLQGARATLTNRIERGVNISDLVVYDGPGTAQRVAVDRGLATGESVPVDLPFVATEAHPVWTPQPSGPADLTEISSFVEDIHTNVVFVNLVNYANHGLKRLDLRVRLRDVAGTETGVAISEENPVAEAAFTLPLTAYLSARTVQFQATKTDTSDKVTTTAWLDWDLTTRGNVISVTWTVIQ